MVSSVREHLPWGVFAAAAALAAALARSTALPATPIDEQLPWVALVVAVAAWMARGSRFALLACSAVPLLAVAAASGDERPRLLAYGVAYAMAIGAAAAASDDHGTIEVRRAILLLLLIALPARLLAIRGEALVGTVILLAGALVLASVRSSWSGFFVAAAAAIASSAEPARASLFPWLLAALAVPIPPMLRPLVMLPLVVAGGRWSWPFLLVALALAALELREQRRDAGAPITLPLYGAPLAAASSLRGLAFLPEVFLAGAGLHQLLGMAVIAASAFLRPPLAILYALAGVSIAVSGLKRTLVPSSGVVFGVAAVALLPWSGAMVGAFPLPIPATGVALVAAMAVLATFSGWPALRVSLSLLLLVFVGWRALLPPGEWKPFAAVLRPGESVTIDAERGRRIELRMSGGSISGLPRRTGLAVIDLVDIQSRGYRRQVEVGEVSDWGGSRPGGYWRSQNGVPSGAIGPIEGFGSAAYLNGASSLAVDAPERLAKVRITASPSLPPEARLHLDAVRVSGQ